MLKNWELFIIHQKMWILNLNLLIMASNFIWNYRSTHIHKQRFGDDRRGGSRGRGDRMDRRGGDRMERRGGDRRGGDRRGGDRRGGHRGDRRGGDRRGGDRRGGHNPFGRESDKT